MRGDTERDLLVDDEALLSGVFVLVELNLVGIQNKTTPLTSFREVTNVTENPYASLYLVSLVILVETWS